MISPTVPANYILANTYESRVNLDETRKQVERSIRDVFTASPDRLMYICRKLYDHEIFTFHIVLFHSEKGEFVEIKYLGKRHTTFHAIELDFAKKTGFTPSERNRVPRQLDNQFYVPFEQVVATLSVVDTLDQFIERAMYFTESDTTYKELHTGIGMCMDLFQREDFITLQPDCTSGFILVERMVDLILHSPEPDLRSLAIDALSVLNRFKMIVRSVAIKASKDKDALVRVLADRLLIASVLMNE
jgi:hypothetical protein